MTKRVLISLLRITKTSRPKNEWDDLYLIIKNFQISEQKRREDIEKTNNFQSAGGALGQNVAGQNVAWTNSRMDKKRSANHSIILEEYIYIS